MIKTRTLIIVFLILHLNIYAQIPDGYYISAEGLTGEELKTELYNIINGHDAQSYTSLWEHFESTDAKDNGKVWDMYSDIPGEEPPYEYSFGTHQCGNYSSEGDCYNREHSFPKSWFNDGSPMYTDMFHIVPTDGYVNGQRGSYPFGETSDAEWTSQNGSKRGSSSYPGYSGTVFEPIDEYKGDFARGYFYMVTRYEDEVAGWESNASGADAVLDGTSYPAFEEWVIEMLMEWHNEDPVSQKEIERNDAIYEIQGNRNPFIDHPEYVEKVWDEQEEENTPPEIQDISINPGNPTSEDDVTINAVIKDDGSIEEVYVEWGTDSDLLEHTIVFNNTTGDNYETESAIPKQNNGTTVFFRIYAEDDSNETSVSDIHEYVVEDYFFIDTVTYSPLHPEIGEDVAVYASVESSASIQTVKLLWGNSSEDYTNQKTLSKIGGYYADSIPGQEDVDSVFLVVEAVNIHDQSAISKEYVIPYESDATGFTDEASEANKEPVIYPVPVKDKVFIEFKKSLHVARVNLYSMEGKTMIGENYNIRTNRVLFNAEDISPGTYILEITTNTDTYEKVILFK